METTVGTTELGFITDTTWTNGETSLYCGSWNGHAAAMDSAACAALITRRSELGGFRLQRCESCNGTMILDVTPVRKVSVRNRAYSWHFSLIKEIKIHYRHYTIPM